MLKVKTQVRPSPIHGLGLFAVEFIKAETIIDQHEQHFDRVITPEEYETYDQVAKNFLHTYGYRPEKDGLFYVPLDNGRFMNHSETPNVGAIQEYGPEIALRDIQAGEELLCDYSLFASEFKGY